MAVYTAINDAGSYFNPVLYTGTGSSNAITGVGFQPDWVWIKVRSEANDHEAYDAVRGATERLLPDLVDVEDTNTAGLTAFGADGFTVNTGHAVNKSTATYVAWNWKVNATSSTNSVGSVDVDLAVNTTAGISIGTYTGDGADGATFGHGLGVVPSMVLVKSTSNATDWYVKHNSQTSNNNLILNTNSAEINSGTHNAGIIDDLASTTTWTMTKSGATDPTNENGSGRDYVVYTFASVKGYSKFGSYVGNGNVDGAFIYTGFRPAFILTKKFSGTGYWTIWDNKRDPDNWCGQKLYPNTDDAEQTEATGNCDFVGNGIKWRNTGASNNSGAAFLYAAFAESPFVNAEGVPTNAR